MKRFVIVLLLAVFQGFALAQNPSVTFERSKEKLQCNHRGIRRCVRYDVGSPQVPEAFEGFRIVFVTDVHYPSKFNDRSLASLGNMLQELKPDAIALGGDYQEDCEHVEPLFSTIASAQPKHGAFAVLGNNDYERCTDVILNSLKNNNITMIEQRTDTIWKEGQRIVMAGVRNDYSARERAESPLQNSGYEDFVVLLTHTPDYVQDVGEIHADLSLAGHTHGGQVTFFGLWAPKNPSHYGRRMLRRLRYTEQGSPVLISNGIGTSRMNVRFCAPSEITLIVLHKTDN